MRWNFKATIVLLAGLLTAGVAWGTAQEPDILLVDGKELDLNTNPLAAWLRAHPRQLPEGDAGFSSNWRGYVATWEVARGKLWLRKVGVRYKRDAKVQPGDDDYYVIRDERPTLFPGRTEVVADWYTGTLIVPTGKLTNYVHMGYGSSYDRYLVVWVDKGEVRKQLELDEKQFDELRKERFKAFQQTEEYRKELAKLLANEEDGDAAENRERTIRFMYEFYSEQYLSAE